MSRWTAAMDARLRELASDLTQSYAAIGRNLGVTKNAVVGRVHRLALPPRPHVGPPRRVPAKPLRAPRRTLPRDVARVAPVPPEEASGEAAVEWAPRPARAIVSLGRGECQFIAGEPRGADTVFCAAQVRAGSSYCPGHHARCWRSPLDAEA